MRPTGRRRAWPTLKQCFRLPLASWQHPQSSARHGLTKSRLYMCIQIDTQLRADNRCSQDTGVRHTTWSSGLRQSRLIKAKAKDTGEEQKDCSIATKRWHLWIAARSFNVFQHWLCVWLRLDSFVYVFLWSISLRLFSAMFPWLLENLNGIYGVSPHKARNFLCLTYSKCLWNYYSNYSARSAREVLQVKVIISNCSK